LAFKVSKVGMVFDFLKPYYYRLEASVAAKGIPSVDGFSNRQTLAAALAEKTPGGGSFDHSLWDGVLKRHVSTDVTFGVVTGCNAVNYAALAKDDDYWAYMELLKNTSDIDTSLTPAEQLAFWINAYNAACIQLIVQHEQTCQREDKDFQLASINQISDKEGPVWDKDAAVIAGKSVSLNHIEHEQLRAKWADASVHGCIVCASASCPNLRPEAFCVEKLQAQMEDQMKSWMTNESKGFKMSGSRVELSRIFLWFAKDFGKDWTELREWLTPYVPAEHQKKCGTEDSIAVRYFEYDWQINRAPVTK
jgi:hypothetical protein